MRYVAAQRSEQKMQQDAVTSFVPRIPPIPQPFDSRMAGLSDSFGEFVTQDAIQEKEGKQDIVGVSTKRSSTHSDISFTDWLNHSQQLDLYKLTNKEERRRLRRRLQRPDCRIRQAMAEEPTDTLMFGVAISMVVGVVLGMSISSSVVPSFRGPREKRPFRSAPSRVHKNTVEKLLSFL